MKLFFGLPRLPSNEVPDAFADDIVSNAPTFDVAVKFADCVLENYIDVDCKFLPTLWAQAPDVSGAIPRTNNGAKAYHSQVNAEFYVKHPDIYMFVDVLKKVQQLACTIYPSVIEKRDFCCFCIGLL